MRHLRVLQGLAALGLIVGLAWLVVLPAFASSVGGAVPPPSSDGVTPVDVTRGTVTSGVSTDCTTNYHGKSTPAYGLYIADPENGTYKTTVGGSQVTFTLKENPPNTNHAYPAYDEDKYTGFTSTGAAVTDVGIDAGSNENSDIKGISDETWYSYAGQPNGFVTSDNYLHAPAQSVNSQNQPTKLYSYSHLTICFNLPNVTVSGTVYQDADKNGGYTSGLDSLQSGWTVDLYAGSTLVGTKPVTSGTYSLTAPYTAATQYRVCEVPPTGSTGWTQSQAPNAAVCTGPGELPNGWTFTPAAPGTSVTGDNFGNYQQAAISGTVFSDADASGTINGPDAGLAGQTVTLYNTTTGGSSTTSTAGDGSYGFSGQVVGDNYTVCVAPSNPFIETVPTSGPACTGSGQASYGYTAAPLGTAGQTGNFGLQPVGSISGQVYSDTNQDGVNNDNSPQAGWTVTLYDASNTQVGSVPSAANGNYKFTLPLTSSSYTVCEAPPSGNWAQSEPSPTGTNYCNGLTALQKGYNLTGFAEGANLGGNDFGNVPAVVSGDGKYTSGDGSYTVQLATPKSNAFVVATGVLNSKPYVSIWADVVGPNVPDVEKITFDDPIVGGQPKYTSLTYSDTFPFSSPTTMQYCQFDPRSDEFTLTSPYNTYGSGGSGLVLPSGETSCVLALTTSLPSSPGGDGTLVAYVYSALDGFRSTN